MTTQEISNKISQGIGDAFESVQASRDEYYSKNQVPSKYEVGNIISKYSNINAGISGATGLVPGPLGMAAAIPEIISVIRNQMAMITDIARANGKKASNELMLEILFGAVGNMASGLVAVHAQKVIVKSASLKVLQSVIKTLGGRVTQQVLKSMAAKWIPLAGAAAMAAWSKYSTSKIGKKAQEIFEKEIIYECDEVATNEDIQMLGVAKAEFENAKNEIDSAINDIKNGDKILKEKIKILISLMRIDGKIEDEEQEYIANFITKSNFASSDEMELIGYLGNNEKMDINYALFKTDPQEALALIIDLIALSSVDEKIHITEKMFIKNIAKMINFNENDALELIEQTKQNI